MHHVFTDIFSSRRNARRIPALVVTLALALAWPISPSRAASPPSEPSRPNLRDPGVSNVLVGTQLTLDLPRGQFQGKLLGETGGQLVFVRTSDGRVVSVPASDVARMTAQFPVLRRPGRPGRRSGTGLIASGAVVVFFSAPILVGGIVFSFMLWPLSLAMPMLITGAPAFGAGVGMLVVGVDRRKTWRRELWTSDLSDVMLAQPEMHGLRLKF